MTQLRFAARDDPFKSKLLFECYFITQIIIIKTDDLAEGQSK